MRKILVAEKKDFSLQAINILSEIGEVDCRDISEIDLKDAFCNYDVVIFRLAIKVVKELLPENPRCRILASPVTGLDHIDIDACTSKGIKVVSLRGEVDFLKSVRATAELTMGLTLALMRHIPGAVGHTREGGWDRDLFRGNEIFRKTVGIIGLGRLGCIVAEYFKAFDAEVIGYDPRADFPHHLARKVQSIEEVFKEAEIITLHLVYNQDTHELINEYVFSCASKKPILINTSRGGVIDEMALINALEKGLISGAALDVIHDEHNITSEKKVMQYARDNHNLLLSPHIGGNTFESFEKTEVFIAQKIVKLLEESVDG